MTTSPTTTPETLPRDDTRSEARASRAEAVRRGREERARRTTELFARTVGCDDTEEREALLEQVIVLNIEVAEAVAALPGVSEVYSVTGALDLVAMVRVADHEQVAEVVADRLNKVPGILRTETHIAFRAYSAHDLEAAFSLGAD